METRVLRLARAIKLDLHEWPGNCYAVAAKIYQAHMVPRRSRVRYGTYHGEIASGSIFQGREFTHHGWIELPDNRIYDPTKWVFTDTVPEVWIGEYSDDYDIASQRLTAALAQYSPPSLVAEKVKLTRKEARVLAAYVPDLKDSVSLADIYRIAHMPPSVLGNLGRPLYTVIKNLGHACFIPFDFWQLVMNDDAVVGV